MILCKLNLTELKLECLKSEFCQIKLACRTPTWAKFCQLIASLSIILCQLNLTELKLEHLKSGFKCKVKDRLYKQTKKIFATLEFYFFEFSSSLLIEYGCKVQICTVQLNFYNDRARLDNLVKNNWKSINWLDKRKCWQQIGWSRYLKLAWWFGGCL